MKRLVKTKLLEGKYVEIREYELKQNPLQVIYCTTKDYTKCNHLGEGFMNMTLKQQEKGKVVNTQQSKFYPYSYYKMYKFLWKPSGIIEVPKYSVSNVRFEGNRAIIE